MFYFSSIFFVRKKNTFLIDSRAAGVYIIFFPVTLPFVSMRSVLWSFPCIPKGSHLAWDERFSPARGTG